MIILYGTLPLPPSINKQYRHGEDRNGNTARFLSEEALQWKEDVYQLLDNRLIDYMNVKAIQDIRELYATESRKKAVEVRKKYYSLELLLVYKNERRDNDSGKLTQDTLFDWIALKSDKHEKGIAFNDRRVVKAVQRRLVDSNVEPHMEFALSECRIDWVSGDLVREYRIRKEVEEVQHGPILVGNSTRKEGV